MAPLAASQKRSLCKAVIGHSTESAKPWPQTKGDCSGLLGPDDIAAGIADMADIAQQARLKKPPAP